MAVSDDKRLRSALESKWQAEMKVSIPTRIPQRAKLWLAKIESGLKLGSNFSDTNHVCSVC
jgi:hypothetical protein